MRLNLTAQRSLSLTGRHTVSDDTPQGEADAEANAEKIIPLITHEDLSLGGETI
jgi:hypothetical protein